MFRKVSSFKKIIRNGKTGVLGYGAVFFA